MFAAEESRFEDVPPEASGCEAEERLAVAAGHQVRGVEAAAQHVGGDRLARLDERLRQMLGVDRAEADVVAVFHQGLRHRIGETQTL